LCEQEIGANAVAFHRSWLATVVFGLWNGFEAIRRHSSLDLPVEQKPFTRREGALLLLMGTVVTTYLLLWSWSLSQTSVANVALLSNLNPLFVGLAGYLLLGRRFDYRFVIGLVMALFGAIAFELERAQFHSDQILGDALAFLSAIFLATYIMLVERLRTRFTTTTIMLWCCGITTLFLLPLLPFIEDRLFPHSSMGWFFIIFQALLCQVLGQGLLAYSLSRLSSGVVAVTLLAEPVLASIFAMFIFSEQVSLFDWVSFAVVLVGIYLAQSSQSAVKVTNEGTQADVLIETQKMVTEAICLWQQRFAIAIHNIPIKKPW
jgi:drug/metabolite transporter (DMT)-like permease